jgi:hypothetical protein
MAKKTVLVCPMDWGLGHASRCIPVIKAFRNEGCRVIVGASGAGADFIGRELKTAAPEIIPFPGFSVSYSRSFLFARLLLQVPQFLYHVAKEKRLLEKMVDKFKPGLIVSDNRYGLVHDSVPSVLITHQIRPSLTSLFKSLEDPLSAVIRKWAMSFDECWIPDFPDCSAAGELIGGWDRLPRVFFTGWLSRFRPGAGIIPARPSGRYPGEQSPHRKDSVYRMMFILSGQEPLRGMLEGRIIEGCLKSGIKALLVRGLPGIPAKTERRGNLEIVTFLDSAEMYKAIGKSQIVVCRSGYSSVMDMLALGKRAVLVPTPGQTEQEYLGKWLGGKGWFHVVSQKDFDVGAICGIIGLADQGTGFPLYPEGKDLLLERVQAVTRSLL